MRLRKLVVSFRGVSGAACLGEKLSAANMTGVEKEDERHGHKGVAEEQHCRRPGHLIRLGLPLYTVGSAPRQTGQP